MKKNFYIMLLSFFCLSCNQESLSENLISFEIYKDNKLIELNLETSKKILKGAHVKSKNEIFIWKGEKQGILTFKNGEKLKIKLSNYGGFFLVEESKKIYSINNNDINEWNVLIGNVKINIF